jgi:hypothetical protein
LKDANTASLERAGNLVANAVAKFGDLYLYNAIG